VYTMEELHAAGLDDFRVFLCQVWEYLGLPPPTLVQLDIALEGLQKGPKRVIIQGFRGVGKSWITVAYVLWRLLLDPQIKIMVVSATQGLADNFSKFCKQIIRGMPLLQHLEPQKDYDAADEWVVGPALPSKDPSVKSVGITGQLTGSRADLIVPDDIEIPKNSFTFLLRERLAELVKEFDAVLKPNGEVKYLGTPQSESSVYTRLLNRGYVHMIWPVEVPESPDLYHGRLGPYIKKLLANGVPAHTPVEPERFPTQEINERKLSYGIGGFNLQFMLDVTPSEIDKHPLRTRDLMIYDCDEAMGHIQHVWGSTKPVNDLVSGGFDGDGYFFPVFSSPEMARYTGTVMAIDPSGRGSDETAYAILRNLHGLLYLVDAGGFKDGFGEETLRALAAKAIRYRVNYWFDELNYGGGMFRQLLKPVMIKAATDARLDPKNPDPLARPPSCDEDFSAWSSTNKENRILDTVGPILRSHRLVVDRRVIEADIVQQAEGQEYSLIYQMTRMARIKGCLGHEDRLEALSMACSYWTERMKLDASRAVETHKESQLEQEVRRYHENANRVGRRGRGSVDSEFETFTGPV